MFVADDIDTPAFTEDQIESVKPYVNAFERAWDEARKAMVKRLTASLIGDDSDLTTFGRSTGSVEVNVTAAGVQPEIDLTISKIQLRFTRK